MFTGSGYKDSQEVVPGKALIIACIFNKENIMPKVGKKIAEWDECQLVKNETKHRLENWQDFYDEEPTEESIQEMLFTSSDFFDDEFIYLTEHLTEIIQKKNPDGYWFVKMENFGWRNLDGHKYLCATDGEKLLREILPQTDCTFHIFNFGKGLAIQNYHHDSPVGNEWYYLKPVSERIYYSREN